MNEKTIKILFVAFIAVLFVAGAFFLLDSRSPSSIKELSAVEVKEYEGKDLSSIGNFRENSIKGPQYIGKDDYRLKVVGLTNGEKSLSYDDTIGQNQNYKKVVTLDCVEGWSVNILWEGILVKDLIDRSAIPAGANTIIFRAVDGYSTSFPVEYIMDNDIIMAYKMNDVVLPPERGFPFQLVAEDKWGYKWIKWITEIEFSPDENYRGYWESRGFSNEGDLDKSKFD